MKNEFWEMKYDFHPILNRERGILELSIKHIFFMLKYIPSIPDIPVDGAGRVYYFLIKISFSA